MDRPVAVAFSGGGDSLALLLTAKAWADDAGRHLLALTIDHQLQSDSADWAIWCARRAERIGVRHETLVWRGEKPKTGLAAAARTARHSLIAERARTAGARVVLMGHTADDCFEAALMRDDGVRVSAPRTFAPSPVWPAGRGVFLLRPLLEVRRADIRQALRQAGETWIEDPANADMRHPRARARVKLAVTVSPTSSGPSVDIRPLFAKLEIGLAGDLAMDGRHLAGAEPGSVRAFLGAALLCVGGGEKPARGDRLDRLVGLIAIGEDFVATLAGTKVSLRAGRLRLTREIGDRRQAASHLNLTQDQTTIWDGRFEVLARRRGLSIRPLAGLAARLGKEARARLSEVPAEARGGLPAIVDEGGAMTCPLLTPDMTLEVFGLVEARLAGACGMMETEASIRRVAKTPKAP